MKNIITIITLLLLVSKSYSQDKQVAYATRNNDTLFVPNDEVGRAIDMLWSTEPIPDTLKSRPVIIYTDSYIIQDMVRTNSTRRPGVKYIQVEN